ncbi:monooxygenase 2 isoform X1 [Nicotiana tabacum]|uniref:Monooxygenase 2 isoform X1 n=1 Tax=Nicotiana tabacum TaxID=4097 RepID=A0A1S4CAF5_TOBAC|nr:monooxygenase 2-like isoform X1 [Nicotiana tomentosiformis]
METEENIVIVGAGIAGLATCLALHRVGLRSIVLESSDSLRATGFALLLWTNAWKALDALGIGDSLRQISLSITGVKSFSADSGAPIKEVSFVDNNRIDYESRCVRRKDLLEKLENEVPQGVIRYSSKVVSIEESGPMKVVHLADGSIIRTKALIGCDGVNSVVANWLGLQKPVNSGRSAIRGFVEYPDKHGYQPKFHAFFGGGARFGFLPSDEKSLYWFCTFTPSVVHFDGNAEQDPIKLKQFVLNKASNMSKELSAVVERTTLDSISCAQLKLRLPWNVLTGNILKNNVCVVGDALHPMTPDLGQGGCSALEDSVVIAKCLGEALVKPIKDRGVGQEDEDEFNKIKKGLEKYAKERRWRSFTFISAAYLSGFIQESGSKVISFLRERFLAGVTIAVTLRMANYDCGKLTVS